MIERQIDGQMDRLIDGYIDTVDRQIDTVDRQKQGRQTNIDTRQRDKYMIDRQMQ